MQGLTSKRLAHSTKYASPHNNKQIGISNVIVIINKNLLKKVLFLRF